MRTLPSTALSLSLLLAAGCGAKDKPEAKANDKSADKLEMTGTKPPERKSEPSLFPTTLARRPCDLLDAAMAAEILGVDDPASLKVLRPPKVCSYRSGIFEATIGYIEVDETIEQAKQRFAKEHASPAAKSDAPAATSDASAIAWQPVEGIGDEAMYDPTVHEVAAASPGNPTQIPANNLEVRVDNLKFRVTARTSKEPQPNREATLATAKAVVAGLEGLSERPTP